LWGILPKGCNTVELMKKAVENKVAYVPGAAFFPCGGGENTMRLNFSYSTPDIIREGIFRLGKLLQEEIVHCQKEEI
jgi:2-aminoadipate transaminase